MSAIVAPRERRGTLDYIQPATDGLRLRVGKDKPDQYEIVRAIVQNWTCDLGRDAPPVNTSSRNAAGLIFDVGTGKTPAVLRLIYAWKMTLKERGDARWHYPSLVVCRNKAKRQIMGEIHSWIPEWSPGHSLMIDGDRTMVGMQLDIWDICNPDIIVLNYDKLVDYNEELRKRGPYLISVMDEAHAIAYASTQRNQAADAIDCGYRVALSGTVMRREPDSLHGVLAWMNPGRYMVRHVKGTVPFPVKGCFWKETPGYLNYYKKVGCPKCKLFLQDFCTFAQETLHGEPARDEYYHAKSPEWGTYNEFKSRYCQIGCSSCGAKLVGDRWVGGGTVKSADKRTGDARTYTCNHRYTEVVGAANSTELRIRLFDKTHLFFSLDARDIPGFPEVLPRKADCILTAKQSEFYRQAEAGLLQYLDAQGEWGRKNVTNALAQLSWLRSIATLPPSIITEKLRGASEYPEWLEGIGVPQESNGGKQRWVKDFFEDYFEKGDKLIVFSEWVFATTDYFTRLRDLLKKRGEYAIHIRGSMKDSDFEESKKAFNTDPLCSVAVCSPAGSESLNLHQGLIGRDGRMWVIHSDIDWVPATIKQRTGRIQRCGGKNAVAFFCVAQLDDGSPTIESRIFERVMSRATTSDLVTGSALSELFKFDNKKDIMSLLGKG